MKVSIITVTYNSAGTLVNNLRSVADQSYPDIEHIVIDGSSRDGTPEILKQQKKIKWISEPDKGIYDAMNKGIKMSTGEVVGILNADDVYAHDHVISAVVENLKQNKVDSVYGDVVFFDPAKPEKIKRHYKTAHWNPNKFTWGFMPPHPSFFVKREAFERYGYYKTDYQIAADYELLIRFLKVNKVSSFYMNEVLVKMQLGGASTRNLNSNFILNREILRACKENGLSTNYLKIYSKYFRKVFELF